MRRRLGATWRESAAEAVQPEASEHPRTLHFISRTLVPLFLFLGQAVADELADSLKCSFPFILLILHLVRIKIVRDRRIRSHIRQ